MRVVLFLVILVFANCNTIEKNPLEQALDSNNKKIKRVMDNIEEHEVQILYTEVTRNVDNSINFIDYSFQVNDSAYFYPASTVKFPIALLALEKMNTQPEFTPDSPFYVEGDTIESTVAKEKEKKKCILLAFFRI